MRPIPGLLATTLAVTLSVSVAGSSPAEATVPPVDYRPPVDATLVDPFRPPPSPFGAGNRGVDYATEPGTPVGAAGPGRVVFVGAVGGHLHVVVLHPDGVRTSYSFLASVSVWKGQRVSTGQVVGVAGASLHFGARVGDAYVDPLALLGAHRAEVRLVPDEPVPAADGAGERRILAGLGGPPRRPPADAARLDRADRTTARPPADGDGARRRALLAAASSLAGAPWLTPVAALTALVTAR